MYEMAFMASYMESFPSGDGFLSGCKSLAFFLYAFLISFSVALIDTPNTTKINKNFYWDILLFTS